MDQVEKLKKRIEGNREERSRYNKMYQDLQDRTRELLEAPDHKPNSFWCVECDADYIGRAFKIIRKLPGKLPVAWYVSYCPSRHKAIKRITEKPNDKYYQRSFIVRRDRSRHKDDLLTPDQERFWLLYGHKHGSDAFKTIDTDRIPTDSPWGQKSQQPPR